MSTDKEKYYQPLKLMIPIRYQYMKKIILSKNKDTFEKSGRIFSRDKVEFPELDKFVKNVLKDKYFKEKVKSVKDLKVV